MGRAMPSEFEFRVEVSGEVNEINKFARVPEAAPMQRRKSWGHSCCFRTLELAGFRTLELAG